MAKPDRPKPGHMKVVICHVPSDVDPDTGELQAPHTIEIAEPALVAHLNHGDYLGECVIVEEPAPEA